MLAATNECVELLKLLNPFAEPSDSREQLNFMAEPKPAGDEIEDIMKEINEIQKDLVSNSKKPDLKIVEKPAAVEEMSLNDFRGSSDEPGMEEMLGEIKDESPPDAELTAGGDVETVVDEAVENDEEEDDDDDDDDDAVETESEEQAEMNAAAEMEASTGEPGDELDQMLEEAEAEAAAANKQQAKTPGKGFAKPMVAEEGEYDTEESALSMTLSGQMKLNLKYAFSGQEVTIRFEDGALKVELSDGTEFKVPVAARRGRSSEAA